MLSSIRKNTKCVQDYVTLQPTNKWAPERRVPITSSEAKKSTDCLISRPIYMFDFLFLFRVSPIISKNERNRPNNFWSISNTSSSGRRCQSWSILKLMYTRKFVLARTERQRVSHLTEFPCNNHYFLLSACFRWAIRRCHSRLWTCLQCFLHTDKGACLSCLLTYKNFYIFWENDRTSCIRREAGSIANQYKFLR